MAGLVLLSASQSRARIEANTEIVAREQARALLQQFERVRQWGQRAGMADVEGMAESAGSAENTPGARAADHIVRSIFDSAPSGTAIRYHLIDNDGGPVDAWESTALAQLLQHPLNERLELYTDGSAPAYRYMALLAQETQDQQNAATEPLPSRPALSITLPATTLLALQDAQIQRTFLLHLAAFALLAGLTHAGIQRAYRHAARMIRLSTDQQAVITARTADLSAAHEQLLESESRYRSVVESAHDGIALIENSRISFANSRLGEMLARPLDELIGLEWTELLPTESQADAVRYQTKKLQGIHVPDCLRTQMRHDDPATRQLTVDLQVRPIKDNGYSAAHWILNIRNVSDRLHAERDRRIAAAVFESVAEAIMVTDSHNRITAVNPAFSRITGYTPAEALGQSSSLLSSGRHEANFYSEMWRSLQQTGTWSGEIWNRRKDGSLYVEWLTIMALHGCCNADGLCDMEGGHVATFTDITQRKEAEDRLRYKAHHDTLTNLPNRSLFEDHLQLVLSQSRRYHRSFALLYIDLDYFKKVNDTLGHAAGDVLLVEAGQRMALCIRESDTLSRFGGDEFAALLSEIDNLEEVEEIARRIVSTLDRPFELAQGMARISGSVGIAIYPQHGTTAEELKNNADLALYSVKRSTRNDYRLYTPELNETAPSAEGA